jgi:hypothetical protein
MPSKRELLRSQFFPQQLNFSAELAGKVCQEFATLVRRDTHNLHSSTLLVVETDTTCISLMLVVNTAIPCTSTLQAVENGTPYVSVHTAGGRKGFILHVRIKYRNTVPGNCSSSIQFSTSGQFGHFGITFPCGELE